MPHRIRLRGPWEFNAETNCFTRRFHQPTGLTPTTRVWLAVNEATAPARIELNKSAIGQMAAGRPARFEITAYLKPQNLLSITLTAPHAQPEASSDGPLGLVSLEIEETSA